MHENSVGSRGALEGLQTWLWIPWYPGNKENTTYAKGKVKLMTE